MKAPSPAVVSADLAETALGCEALVRARRLAEWVGSGRELTSSGVPRPAAAVEACRVLGISLPRPRLRSALDVDEFMVTWATAVEAGLIAGDARRAKAVPDTLAAAGPEQVLDTWVKVAAGVLGVPDDPCAGCLIVLHELHTAGRPLKITDLAGALSAAESGAAPGEPCPDCGIVHDPADLLGLDDLLGTGEPDEEDDQAHAEGTVTGLVAFGAATQLGGRVRLTPLGSMLATAIFEGCAPSPDADADQLVSEVSALPPSLAVVLAGPWLDARKPEAAVRELLAFAESADGSERLVALTLARHLGPGAVAAWQEWASRPGFGAYARQWLADQGQPVRPRPADEAWLTVDALATALGALEDMLPPLLLSMVLRQQLGGETADLLERLRGSGHPAADEIATRLGGPDPVPLARTGGKGTQTGGAGERRQDLAESREVYQLRISLRYVDEPPVWRQVLVPAGLPLGQLHDVIQLAMGWEDGHMHVFRTRAGEYGIPDPELGFADEYAVRLAEVLPRKRSKLLYTYDFGDDWEHDVVVENRRAVAPGDTLPCCVAGQGACPPEDCGGVWGYDNLKEILADPRHEDHEDMLEWMGLDSGADFDPAEFSLDEANARLAPLIRTT